MKTTDTIKNELKYNIKSRLANMPQYEAVKLRKNICKTLNISDETFSRRINANETDTLDFPGKHLIVVAQMLGVSPSELLNNPIKPLQ